MKTPRMALFAIGFLLILGAAGYRAHISRKFSVSTRQEISGAQTSLPTTNELDLMANSDPLSNAAVAIASNDLRFVAISGNYAPPIPGVNSHERLLNTNEIKWVDGSARFSTRTYSRAVEYASSYNQRIVEYLKRVKSVKGQTEVSP